MTTRRSQPALRALDSGLQTAITRGQSALLQYQTKESYWWFTLEANESISAEYIFLMHFMGNVDAEVEAGIAKRILNEQREDGTWGLYWESPAELSTTIECYFALRLAGYPKDHPALSKARSFILHRGGITESRVFTRIHLAMFGVVPWSAVPAMPVEVILLPHWAPISVYEFSSWARACIIPLLMISEKKPVCELPEDLRLDELFVEAPAERKYHDDVKLSGYVSWENFFQQIDKALRLIQPLAPKQVKSIAMKRCEEWISTHIMRTEDIYPAMAYAALALHTIGEPLTNPVIEKALEGLARFRQRNDGVLDASVPHEAHPKGAMVHQQCCISPIWDTPWSATALLDSGFDPKSPALIKTGRWLIDKQITDCYGDWHFKNPDGEPGGWAFEFQNDYFPDVDDTIQVLTVLHRLGLPEKEKAHSIRRGLDWLISMQNDDGGWAAFDKNNSLELVNKIPFSDHGACLDPSSPDITGRVLELLSHFGYQKDDRIVRRAIRYLKKNQETNGSWFGRWGVNYIYGTWAVLTGLAAIGENLSSDYIRHAVQWLKSVQRTDGGFSESPESYNFRRYVPYGDSAVPSQTGWALMGLVAAGEARSDEARCAADWLIGAQLEDGTWDEPQFTGTGFPGHFYIRYHGYRHYFPLLALGRYQTALK
ncbi:MAG: squalene--hopene cyclase [Deltaproteobacteria bacterium CG11_big_fil_rev_8_21_14_0_20_47_16]|nr:MAG: squalene--hopene cyclase [Deltaproteobacteria bacterium CG11_big_fil_rev_8_21_14_0_20_47_16]